MCERVRVLQAVPEREIYEAVRIRPKLQWRVWDVGDDKAVASATFMCWWKLQIVNRASPRERPCVMQLARPRGKTFIGAPTICAHDGGHGPTVPCWVLALLCSHYSFLCPFGNRMFTLGHCILEGCNFFSYYISS
jgi:hypothetical protein